MIADQLSQTIAKLPLWPYLAGAAAITLVGGFLRGFVGFGGALAIIPVLALIFTPTIGVATHLIMEIPGMLQLMPIAYRQCSRQTVVPALLAVLVGTPFGVYVLTTLDPKPMRIAISIFVLAMVVMLARNWRPKGTMGTKAMAKVGFIGGVVQGGAGIGGPPIVAVLMSRGDDNDTTRGNILAMMGSLVIIAIPLQWYFGVLTVQSVFLGACAAPFYMAATYLGARFYSLGGQRIYRQVAIWLLGTVAVASLASSILK
ncbi:MAG: sulfite exporter TauE/SafE family protein [Rhodospirillaceae bacterium]